MPLISVYIPTRNRRALLEIALGSVLRQTFSDFEVIVVDEGSTDDTGEYLRAMSEKDFRVRIISNTVAQGAPRARNRAIKDADGVFVTGLDDDYAFEPYRLETLIGSWRCLEKYSIARSCLYSQDRWVVSGRTLSYTSRQGSTLHSAMFIRNHVGNQVFAPKSNFLEAGLFDPSLPAWQDFEMFYRIMQRFGVARLVDVPSYIFEVDARPDRISVREHNIREAYRIICEKHLDQAPLDRQRLALQMFSDYYGIRPSLKDLARFSADGRWIKGHFSMARAFFRKSSTEAGKALAG